MCVSVSQHPFVYNLHEYAITAELLHYSQLKVKRKQHPSPNQTTVVFLFNAPNIPPPLPQLKQNTYLGCFVPQINMWLHVLFFKVITGTKDSHYFGNLN